MFWKNKSNLLLMFSIIFAGLLISANWVLYQKIKLASAVVLEAEQNIASLEKKQRELTGAISAISVSGDNITAINNIYLNEDNFVDLVELLESLALESGNAFKAESAMLPARPAGGPTAGKEPASILFTVEGRFANIYNFITLLDNIPYAGLIENISVGPKTDGTKNTGILTARINYLIFSFKPK